MGLNVNHNVVAIHHIVITQGENHAIRISFLRKLWYDMYIRKICKGVFYETATE